MAQCKSLSYGCTAAVLNLYVVSRQIYDHGYPTSLGRKVRNAEEVEAVRSSIPRLIPFKGPFNNMLARSNGRVIGMDDTTSSESESEAAPAKNWSPKHGQGKTEVKAAPSITQEIASEGSNIVEKNSADSASRENVVSTATASPVKPCIRRTPSPSNREAWSDTRPSCSRTFPQKLAKFVDEDIVTSRQRTKATLSEAHPDAGLSRPAINNIAERRHTLAITAAAHQRVQHLKVKARPEGAGDTLASSIQYHGQFITAEDHQRIVEYCMRGILKEVASSTGFTYEVVEHVWGLCGTIAGTKVMLNRMRKKAQKDAGEEVEDESSENVREKHEAEEEEETVHPYPQGAVIGQKEQYQENMDADEAMDEGVKNKEDEEKRVTRDRERSLASEDDDADDRYDQEHELLYNQVRNILRQVRYGKK